MNQPLLTIKLLGQAQITVHGNIVHPRYRRSYLLLALLALRPNREVRREWLADLLWPHSIENLGLASLRQCLHDLRQSLGIREDCLVTSSTSTLWLNLSNVTVDVIAFDTAVAHRDPASLLTAISLHSGPFLEGSTEEWIIHEREKRTQCFLCALETLAADAMQRNDSTTAIRFLQSALATDSMRESVCRSLMYAHMVRGEYVQATEIYRNLRRQLHQQLMGEPSPETTELYQKFRAEPRSFTLTKFQSHPVDRPTASVRFIPHLMTTIIGREKEIQNIRAAFCRSKLVCLKGAGGVGKTSLAIRMAHEISHDTVDEVLFVELAAVGSEEIEAAIWTAMGSRQEPPRNLADALRPHRLLLVLDNCEHVIRGCARLVDMLLRSCPTLRVLITSRQPLGLSGESALYVAPLVTPEPAQLTGADAATIANEYPAIQLFVDRAQAVRKDFSLTNENLDAVAQICWRLDGLPLALERIASCLRAMSLEQIIRCSDAQLLAMTGGQTSTTRQHSLTTTLDWSYDLLSNHERLLLSRLSFFSGRWTEEAARFVCVDWLVDEIGKLPHDAEPEKTMELLMGLTDKSLVSYEEVEGHSYYRLLNTTRVYCRNKLKQSGEYEALCRKYAAFITSTSERGKDEPKGCKSLGTMQVCGGRIKCFGVNQEEQFTIKLRENEHVLSISDLEASCFGKSYQLESMEAESNLTIHLPETEAKYWTTWDGSKNTCFKKALLNEGTVAYKLAAYDVAKYKTKQCLSQANNSEDQGLVADCFVMLGRISYRTSEYSLAVKHLTKGLTIAQRLGDEHRAAVALTKLGDATYYSADYLMAREYCFKSLEISHTLRDEYRIAETLNILGRVAYRQGDVALAQSCCDHSLYISQASNTARTIADALDLLALLNYKQGGVEQALLNCDTSIRMRFSCGDIRGITETSQVLAQLLADEKQMEASALLVGKSAAVREKIGVLIPKAILNEQEQLECSLHAYLGEEAYFTYFAKGRVMPWEQVVSYALAGRIGKL